MRSSFRVAAVATLCVVAIAVGVGTRWTRGSDLDAEYEKVKDVKATPAGPGVEAAIKALRAQGATTLLALHHGIWHCGRQNKTDRVRYMCYPDWVVDPAKRPPADFWAPQISYDEGLAEIAASFKRG